MRPIPRTVLAGLAALVVLPVGGALACSIAFVTANAVPVQQADLRVPVRHEGSRAAWGLQPGWKSFRASLSEPVDVAGRANHVPGVAYRQQRAFSFFSSSRWLLLVWKDDADSATASCALAGQRAYVRPKLLTRQTRKAVFVVFVTRLAGGDRTGCVIARPAAIDSCVDLAFGEVLLQKPLGARNLVLDWFSPAGTVAAT